MYDNQHAHTRSERRHALITIVASALAIALGAFGLAPATAQDFDSDSVVRKVSNLSEKLELTTNSSRILTLDKNSRSKEQGVTPHKEPAAAPAPNEGLLNGLLTAIHNPPKEPFRMEIVEAQGVREVLFDVETGRPIHRAGETSATAGPTLDTPAKSNHSKKDAPTESSDTSKLLDEFPINLDALKK